MRGTCAHHDVLAEKRRERPHPRLPQGSRYTSIFLKDRGLSDTEVGLALGLGSLSFFILPLWAAMADKQGPARPLVVMLAVGAVLFSLQSLTNLGTLPPGTPTVVYLTILRVLIAGAIFPGYTLLDGLAMDACTSEEVRDAGWWGW